MNDFSKKTIKSLAKKGISIYGKTAIPGNGPYPWENAETGYKVDDNGTGKIMSFLEVLDLVK